MRRTHPDLAENLDSGDPEEEEDQVMSEVHLGCPPNLTGPYFSHFTISPPPDVEVMRRTNFVRKSEVPSAQHVISLDEDGDLILDRRNKDSEYKFSMTIQHTITSSIPCVGLQVWRAELVLADFVLHNMFTTLNFDGVVAVELGAGTGLVGMLLGRVAKAVFLTDHGDEVLENCAMNVHLNSGDFPASVYVRELDWKASWPPPSGKSSASQGRYGWSSEELEEFQRASLLLAADVIYSDDLTDAFFSSLEKLMLPLPDKVLYLALEKRYNFTLDDLSVVANGYSHFRSYFKDETGCSGDGFSQCFVGKCIDLSEIPQYVREYNRGEDVEIWQIKYEKQA